MLLCCFYLKSFEFLFCFWGSKGEIQFYFLFFFNYFRRFRVNLLLLMCFVQFYIIFLCFYRKIQKIRFLISFVFCKFYCL